MKLILLIGMLIDRRWHEPTDEKNPPVEVDDKEAYRHIDNGHAVPEDAAIRENYFRLNPKAEKKCKATAERLDRERNPEHFAAIQDKPVPNLEDESEESKAAKRSGKGKSTPIVTGQVTGAAAQGTAPATDELAGLALEEELKLLLRANNLTTKDAIRKANLQSIAGVGPVYAQRILAAVGEAG